jgi:hypothetical protein
VVRDSLAGHAVYLRFMFEGSTVAPPPGPARCRPLTGQHSCRQLAKVIVVNQMRDAQGKLMRFDTKKMAEGAITTASISTDTKA